MGTNAPLGAYASGTPPVGDAANAVLAGSFAAVGPGKAFAFRGPMNIWLWGAVNTTLTTTAGSSTATIGSAAGVAAGNAVNSVNVPPGTTIGALSGTTATLAFPPVTLSGNVSSSAAQITNLPATAGLLGAVVTVSSTAEGVTLPAGTTVTGVVQAAVGGAGGIVSISNPPSAVPPTPGPVSFDFAPNGNAITTTGADVNATFTGPATPFPGTVQLESSFDGARTWLFNNAVTTAPARLFFGEPERFVFYRLNCVAYSGVAGVSLNYRVSQTGGAAESLSVGPLVSG